MTWIRDQVRLERHKHLLKGLYTRGLGLSIVLGWKGKPRIKKRSIGLLCKRGNGSESDHDLRYKRLEVHSDQEACLKGESMEEPLVDEGEVDSKIIVGRGNNQVGKE